MIPLPNRLALKLVIALCGALLLVLVVQDRNRWKAKTSRYAGLLAGERAAHAATAANFRAATEQARRADAENAARVRAEQAAINERTINDYESRIAAARTAAGRMRQEPGSAAADPGRRRATPVSGLPVAAEGALEAAGENRLPRSERLIATEQAIQLDELIKWVRRQAAVEPSPN